MMRSIQPILGVEVSGYFETTDFGVESYQEYAARILSQLRHKIHPVVVKDFSAVLPDSWSDDELFLWCSPSSKEIQTIANLDQQKRSRIILFDVFADENLKEIAEYAACAGLINSDTVSMFSSGSHQQMRLAGSVGIFGYKKLFDPKVFDSFVFRLGATEHYGLFYSHNILELDQLLLAYTKLLFSAINNETEDLTSEMG